MLCPLKVSTTPTFIVCTYLFTRGVFVFSCECTKLLYQKMFFFDKQGNASSIFIVTFFMKPLIIFTNPLTIYTLHLKVKKLSTNSPRDFFSVLDTINHYWIDPAKHFCLNLSSLSAIYDRFKLKFLKVVK